MNIFLMFSWYILEHNNTMHFLIVPFMENMSGVVPKIIIASRMGIIFNRIMLEHTQNLACYDSSNLFFPHLKCLSSIGSSLIHLIFSRRNAHLN